MTRLVTDQEIRTYRADNVEDDEQLRIDFPAIWEHIQEWDHTEEPVPPEESEEIKITDPMNKMKRISKNV